MIPINDIRAWSNIVPWVNDEQIEQDLVISRSLIEIFSDDNLASQLAFRGGTAIHKLFLQPQPRYSEDIDLVQKESGPIKEIITRIQKKLAFINKPVVKQKANNNTLLFRFNSEGVSPVPLRLKVEINCREHFTVFGYREIPFSVSSKWYSGSANIHTYNIEELLGTKLRALYQRKKGRDLFDLHKAMIQLKPDISEILTCYHDYMKFAVGKSPSRKQFLMNVEEKIKDEEFINDTMFLLRPEEKFKIYEAYEYVKQNLIEKT
jgi:predicted nucleotidyltransferase component of viral defense system